LKAGPLRAVTVQCESVQVRGHSHARDELRLRVRLACTQLIFRFPNCFDVCASYPAQLAQREAWSLCSLELGPGGDLRPSLTHMTRTRLLSRLCRC
jgi:hypothetical protein